MHALHVTSRPRAYCPNTMPLPHRRSTLTVYSDFALLLRYSVIHESSFSTFSTYPGERALPVSHHTHPHLIVA